MKTLYLDCSMGAAGDMLMAALLELYPDRDKFLLTINEALSGKAHVVALSDTKCGISGTHISVLIDGQEEGEEHHHHDHVHHYHHHEHDHHHHGQHHHTGIKEIYELIDGFALPAKVKQDAKDVYQIIAEAEAQVHGRDMEHVHFHEVGSIDALADVLGVCMLMNELAPEKVYASPVHVGSGTVKCAHGILPVPAPATELILRGIPIYSGNIKSELCTPTGAALLKYYVNQFCPMPVMRVSKSGNGTGKKDFEAANIVRALLGETDEGSEVILELKCNLDDMEPEALAFALDRLFKLGALDVYFTNIGMKKCRPAVMLTCMCREADRENIIKGIFKHTTTLGIREYVCNRYTLKHEIYREDTPYGSVRIKKSCGWGVYREKYEYEDMASIAGENGLSLAETKAIIDENRKNF